MSKNVKKNSIDKLFFETFSTHLTRLKLLATFIYETLNDNKTETDTTEAQNLFVQRPIQQKTLRARDSKKVMYYHNQ